MMPAPNSPRPSCLILTSLTPTLAERSLILRWVEAKRSNGILTKR